MSKRVQRVQIGKVRGFLMGDESASVNSGVLAGTHTAAPAGDLFGSDGQPMAIEGRAAGSRAGRPNKLSRIMAAKVQDEHGTTVLQEMVRLGMAKPADLAKELIEAAREIAEAAGQPFEEVRGTITVQSLMRFKADMLATAAPYLHAKRAPEDGKGRAQPVVIAFAGLGAADLRRADDVLTDDNMMLDLVATALGPVEGNQGLSQQLEDAASRIESAGDEIANDHKDMSE